MKKLKIISILIMFISVCILSGCGSTMGEAKTIAPNNQKTKITPEQVEKYGFNLFILKFSNIIFEYQGKKFKFPIFQGTSGDVLYNDYLDYCWGNGLMSSDDIETGFVIKCKKGEIKKTFHEILKFYKSNLLKNVDIEKPEIILYDGRHALLYYIKIDGVTWILSIRLFLKDNNIEKSVYDLQPDENRVDTILYNFDISKE